MSSSRRIARVFAALCVAALLVAGPATAAQPISLAKARVTAGKAARVAARTTHATTAVVGSCRRQTSRKALCKVNMRYSTGASRCTLDVFVTFASRRSSRLVYAYGQTICYR